MDISKTLFVVQPDEKFQCSYHGGLMDTPIENVECHHCFCSFCIETLSFCPIDNTPISNISVNVQLKDEFDNLLCYCQYGVEENEINGEITTKVNGCNCLISYGSKVAHESVCKFNMNNEKSLSLSYQDFYEMKFPSDGQLSSSSSIHSFTSPSGAASSSSNKSSNNTSPKSNTSFSSNHSKSPSFEQISLQQAQLQQAQIEQIQQLTSPPKCLNGVGGNEDDYFDNNALWESSTSLFFCNRYCPNKELGCCYSAKSEQDIAYHLEIECFCQKMKDKINLLQSKVEEKEQEIASLILSKQLIGKTSPSSSCNSNQSSSPTSPLSLSNSNNTVIPLSNSSSCVINKNNSNSNTNTIADINNSGSFFKQQEQQQKQYQNKQIQNYTIGKIIGIFFDVIKKGIKKSIKKVKKFFKRKNSNSPYKNFIKIK